MFLMRADTLRGQVGGGFGPWKWRVFWAHWIGIEPARESFVSDIPGGGRENR